MRPKALVLGFRSPYPMRAGYQMRFHYVAELLQREYDVHLLTLQEIPAGNGNGAGPFSEVVTFPLTRPAFLAGGMEGLARGLPFQVGSYYRRGVRRWLERRIGEYALVYVHYVRMAPYVAGLDGFHVLDYHDAISRHYARALAYSKGFWRLVHRLDGPRLRAYEAAVLRDFHGAFVSSELDRRWILEHAGDGGDAAARLVTLPMGVRPECLAVQGRPEKPWIVMLGNMRYYPNVDGAEFFATEVLPRIRKTFPTVEFHIVGAEPIRRVRQLSRLPGVHVTGYLDDPWSYVAQASVAVAPIRFGAGIQNKVLEAMALSKPVVCTSMAAEGIACCTPGRHLLVADAPQAMAALLSDLLGDESARQKIGRDARTLVETHYTWERVGGQLLTALRAWRSGG